MNLAHELKLSGKYFAGGECNADFQFYCNFCIYSKASKQEMSIKLGRP